MSALLAVLRGDARLSRRDRACFALALECLRADWCTDAIDALYAGTTGRECCARELLMSLDLTPDTWPSRELRARLALVLRLVLRCDAGSPPPAWMLTYWHRDRPTTVAIQVWERIESDPEHDARDRIERITPLWDLAPSRST